MDGRKLKFGLLAFSIAILVLLVLYANPQKFFSLVAGSDYSLLFAAFLVSTTNVFLRIMKWKILADIPVKNILPAQLLGITISNFSPGKFAEPVKALILKMRHDIPVSSTLPSIVWERVLDVIVLVLLSLAAVIFFLPLTQNVLLFSLIGFGAFLTLVVASLGFLLNKKFRLKLFGIAKRLPLLNRITESFIENFGKRRISAPKIAYSFLFTAASWILEGFILHFSFRAIGISLDPFALASAFALATIIGISTALPGGLGSTDVVMVIFAGSLGVGSAFAVTGVLLARFLSVWYASLLGGVSLIYLMKKSDFDYKNLFK